MTDLEVPGYDVVSLLGTGALGEVWRARQRSSGADVVLRRLAGVDRHRVDEVRAQARTIRGLRSRHLIRLQTTTLAEGDEVLVLDYAAGGSLVELLTVRRTLLPGEVVTVLAPLAEALAEAHAKGLVHARVRASAVLLGGEGMPLLEGLGLTSLYDPADTLDPTGGLGASADVWALGALGHLLLTGAEPTGAPLASLAPTAPLPLVEALDSALAPDPTSRPTAGALAAALLASCQAMPVTGVRPAAGPPPTVLPTRSPRPRPRRRLAIAVAAGVAVIAVVGLAGAHGGTPTRTSTRVVPPLVVAPPGWDQVVHELDQARARAFAAGDAALLREVYLSSSPQLAVDAARVAALARLRRTAVGVEHEVTAVQPLSQGATAVQLRVVERLAAFDVLDALGRVVEHYAAGPVRTRVLLLDRAGGGWRVRSVVEGPSAR